MIPKKNTSQRYGVYTQLLHWTTAALILLEIFLVYARDYIPDTDPLNLLFILIHKGLGVIAIGIGILFCLWHVMNIKPLTPQELTVVERKLSFLAKYLLLLMMVLMPVSGFLMSIFNAKPINMYFFVIPALARPDEFWAGFFHQIHVYVSYGLIAVVGLHIAAALRHHFWLQDNILRRMLPMKLK